MDTVDAVYRYINRTLETEGHIGSEEVIINGFGKGYNVQSFLT